MTRTNSWLQRNAAHSSSALSHGAGIESVALEVAYPDMGLEPLQLLRREPAAIAHGDVPFHVAHRAHAGDDGGDGGVAQLPQPLTDPASSPSIIQRCTKAKTIITGTTASTEVAAIPPHVIC